MQMRGYSVIFRLSNYFCLWLYFLELPGWHVIGLVSFFSHGCLAFWNLHRYLDGDGFVYHAVMEFTRILLRLQGPRPSCC